MRLLFTKYKASDDDSIHQDQLANLLRAEGSEDPAKDVCFYIYIYLYFTLFFSI